MNTKRNMRTAFTLIELLLVMVILIILASIIVPNLANQSTRARITKAKSDIHVLQTALASFQIDCGRFPTNEEGLTALTSKGSTNGWNGPYIQLVRRDPWGSDYIYHAPGDHFPDSFDLYSAGPDRNPDSPDDVANWHNDDVSNTAQG